MSKFDDIVTFEYSELSRNIVRLANDSTERSVEFVNDIKLNDFSEAETRETVKQIEIKKLEEKMTEFDNVREALAQLILINESEVHNITEDGVKRKANIDDLRVINKQVLFNLADLLGMSDLYCKS